MTVAEIIKQVRFCIDEETVNLSCLNDDNEDVFLDNIVEANIPHALRWIALTAAASPLLAGAQSTETKADSSATSSTTLSVETYNTTFGVGIITLPDNVCVFNVNRVRASDWYKASIPIEDTDLEALTMFDENTKGSVDRPIAAIMRETPLKILVQPIPTNGTITISFVGVPNSVTIKDGEKVVEIATAFESALIYYCAYLLLSAFDDSKATAMYQIATQQLGLQLGK